MTDETSSGEVAQRLEQRTLSRENSGSNPLVAVWKLWQNRSLNVALVHSAVNEYLTTDSGACEDSL